MRRRYVVLFRAIFDVVTGTLHIVRHVTGDSDIVCLMNDVAAVEGGDDRVVSEVRVGTVAHSSKK